MPAYIPYNNKHLILNNTNDFRVFLKDYCGVGDEPDIIYVNFGTKESPAQFMLHDFTIKEMSTVREIFLSPRLSPRFVLTDNCYFESDFPITINASNGSHIKVWGRDTQVNIATISNCVVYASNAKVNLYNKTCDNKIILWDAALKDYVNDESQNFIKAFKNSKISEFYYYTMCKNCNNISLFDHSTLYGYLYCGEISLHDFSYAEIEGSDKPISLYDFATLDVRNAEAFVPVKENGYDCSVLYNTSYLNTTKIQKISYFKKYNIQYDPEKETAIFYKAVHKGASPSGKPYYFSEYDHSFKYKIGERIVMPEDEFNKNRQMTCASGIHIAFLNWALEFSSNWKDRAILELEVPIDSIIIPFRTDGKVRTSEASVIREVPEEELCNKEDII
jgi:hypothetical protein